MIGELGETLAAARDEPPPETPFPETSGDGWALRAWGRSKATAMGAFSIYGVMAPTPGICPTDITYVAPEYVEIMSEPIPPEYFLTISQYNIKRGLHGLDELTGVVGQQKHGIACLNEADSSSVYRLRKSTELQNHAEGWNLTDEGEYYGNVILTDLEIKSFRNHKLPTLDGHEPRGALFATLDYEGEDLLVVATHLVNGRGRNNAERAAQINTILGWLQSQAYRGKTVILCGDFNMTDQNPSYPVLSKEFVDSAATIHGAARVGTLPGTAERIDYIWADKDVAIVRYRITGEGASDHCRAEVLISTKQQ